MSRPIKVSEEHGLNPSISVCFYCGKDKGVMLFGKLKGDVKAPHRILADYEPCDECAKRMKQGRVVIEVTTKDMGILPIMPNTWPTGRWCVISREAAKRLFKDDRNTHVLLEYELYDALIAKASNK